MNVKEGEDMAAGSYISLVCELKFIRDQVKTFITKIMIILVYS
jgi:hypothetical protein